MQKNHLRSSATLAVLILALVAEPGPARAQIVASERGTVSQTVDGTVIDIRYSRPTLRGRMSIFDSEVPRNLLWTPGADWATTIGFSKDVTVNGTPVPAGRYSVWMVTNRVAWQIVLDPDTAVFHVPHPEPELEQIAFTATPDTTGPHMETLAFYFPEVRSDGATLRMHWERTMLDLDIGVQPSRDLTITAEAAEPFLGRYAVTAQSGPAGPGHTFEMDLVHANRHIETVLDMGEEWGSFDTWLAPAADQVFNPVWLMNGRIAGVMDFMFFEFALDDSGRAVSFEVRGPDDDLWMSGSRVETQ